MIKSIPEKIELYFAHQTIRSDEIRITPHRFFEQANALKQILLRSGIVSHVIERARANKQIVRDDIFCRRLRYRLLFSRR